MLLTHTSKMPCASWSIEARKNCPMAKLLMAQLAKGEDVNPVCKECYACKGRYRFNNVVAAQRRRKAFVLKSLRKDKGETFISTMVEEIKKTKVNLFRIHDSGDFFNRAYIKAWISICERLPEVKFRCPTREWAFPDPKKKQLLLKLANLPNVSLQPSALNINEKAPKLMCYSAGMTVITREAEKGEFVCPATRKDKPHSCHENNCYVCWDKEFKKGIAYIKH